MRKLKVIPILLSLIFLGSIALTSNAYLPKADLIKGTGPEVYVLENGVKRWIPDQEVFEHRRYKWTNIKIISDLVLDGYPQAENLDIYDDYPEGTLLRGSGPEVYLIELGKRRWFPNPEIFEGQDYGWKYIYQIDDDKLEAIIKGDNITLTEPNRYPNTIILEGPAKGKVLENTKVTFKYSGTDPLGEAGYLTFETYLNNYDSGWQNQYSNYTETYNLSGKSKAYTFFVRAKNEYGYYDPSPASLSFRIGVSPYYQEILFNQVEPDKQDFTNDYIVLRNGSDPKTINITDWTIETSLKTITISQAAKKLTYPYFKSSQVDIDLAEGDKVVISAGLAPDGVNFRANKCTGYLDQLFQYEPSLDEGCPYLHESEYNHLTNNCQDFIDDLSRCAIPDYSGNYEVSSDSECTSFLTEKFNYSQCYQNYYQEADFLSDKWRVFLGKSIDVLDNDHDTIILRDKDGLLVDEYSY